MIVDHVMLLGNGISGWKKRKEVLGDEYSFLQC